MRVTVPLDRLVIAELQRERSLLSDPDLGVTIARRVEIGMDLIARAADADLDWKPVSSRAEPHELEIPDYLEPGLQATCVEVGYEQEVVLATFAASDECRPEEITALDAFSRVSRPAFQRDKYLRTEVGRGHIYKAAFELPGFQLAFLRLAGQGIYTRNEVLGEALLALAREACTTGEIGGMAISDEAASLATKMVEYAGRKAEFRYTR